MLSPLRYPGGKARLGPWLAWSMRQNGLRSPVFAEAYCGGAGAAVYLLTNNYVSRIELNDLDPAVAAFWRSAVYRSREMARMVEAAAVNLEERERQREILKNPDRHGDLDLGFAALFLNRVNHSGIIRSGPIGGKTQKGRYRLDVRFARSELVRRILSLGGMADRIGIHERDALDFLENEVPAFGPERLVFLDPPYFHKSKRLYRHLYGMEDHRQVATAVRALACPWVVTYDHCREIECLYEGLNTHDYSLTSHAGSGRLKISEILIYGNLMLPCPPQPIKVGGPYPRGYPGSWS